MRAFLPTPLSSQIVVQAAVTLVVAVGVNAMHSVDAIMISVIINRLIYRAPLATAVAAVAGY